MKINAERLRQRMDQINSIAVTEEQGMMRLALSDADKAARDLLCRWLDEAGMQVKVDDLGNIYGYLNGTKSGALPICSGSHMDTQPNGGKYDGFFGVMAALEAVCSIQEQNGSLKSPLVVVDWTNEEGARFSPPMLASGVIAGNFTKDWVYQIQDEAGASFGQELKRIGYLGAEEHRLKAAKYYVEAHIEQGPVLEAEAIEIGAVTGALGITGLDVEIYGEADHAGPTPMGMRKDALLIASETLLAIKTYVEGCGDPAVVTMGTISVEPSTKNIIPGKAKYSIDMRHQTDEDLTELEQEIKKIIEAICLKYHTTCNIQRYWRADPVHFHRDIVAEIESAAQRSGRSCRRITSGAGHDAVFISSIIPTGMLFIPSIGGKSHCPQEDSLWEDIVAGTEVLADVIIALDNKG